MSWIRRLSSPRQTLEALSGTLRFILEHPLNRGRRARALLRYGAWQLGSRLVPGPVVVPFVNDTRLVVSPGMTGATGNLYVGLQEYADMAFVLHLLRPDDVFVDVGANVGSYTVLASGCVGASTISVEPIPETFELLLDNVRLNRLEERVRPLNVGIARAPGELEFTRDLDTVNRVLTDSDRALGARSTTISVLPLDEVVGAAEPVCLKVDVEGFEFEVLRGASETLERSSLLAIVAETNDCSLAYGIEGARVRALLAAAGFFPHRYDPERREVSASRDTSPRSGNTLFLRDTAGVCGRLRHAPRYRVGGRTLSRPTGGARLPPTPGRRRLVSAERPAAGVAPAPRRLGDDRAVFLEVGVVPLGAAW